MDGIEVILPVFVLDRYALQVQCPDLRMGIPGSDFDQSVD